MKYQIRYAMITKILSGKTELYYSDKGSGPALVLLHGYLESLHIWGKFADRLAERYRVICPDLPGHGNSGVLGEMHSMEMLAECIIAIIDHCKINKCFVTGHSMGGYTGLAMLERYPERLGGLCLFHSHPFPDTRQTMRNRCREIVLVGQGKKELISKINIPKAFAPQNVEPMKADVDRATEIAVSTPDEGIVACLNGMMARPSKEELLSRTTVPVLLVAGKYDNYINLEEVAKKIRLPEGAGFVTLENSGHIGFIEETEKSVSAVSEFISASGT